MGKVVLGLNMMPGGVSVQGDYRECKDCWKYQHQSAKGSGARNTKTARGDGDTQTAMGGRDGQDVRGFRCHVFCWGILQW